MIRSIILEKSAALSAVRGESDDRRSSSYRSHSGRGSTAAAMERAAAALADAAAGQAPSL